MTMFIRRLLHCYTITTILCHQAAYRNSAANAAIVIALNVRSMSDCARANPSGLMVAFEQMRRTYGFQFAATEPVSQLVITARQAMCTPFASLDPRSYLSANC